MLKKLLENAQFVKDVRSIYATPEGKRFFSRFFQDTHVTRPVFSTDPSVTQYNEGKRHLGTSYLRIIANGQRMEEELVSKLEEIEKNKTKESLNYE